MKQILCSWAFFAILCGAWCGSTAAGQTPSNAGQFVDGENPDQDPYNSILREEAGMVNDTGVCDIDAYEKEKKECSATFMYLNSTKAMNSNIQWQNRWLLKQFSENAIDPKDRPDLMPSYGFAFLNISSMIYTRLCDNYFVPHNFIKNVEYLFRELSFATAYGTNRSELIAMKEAGRTIGILNTCLENTTGQNYTADDCGRIEGVCPNLATDFNAEIFDPLLDAIWHIYETIHAHCFRYFQNDNRMWHVYAYGFIDLFTKEIVSRWPRKLETSEEVWERLLSPNYRFIGTNIELCTSDVIKTSTFPYRISRDMMPDNVRLEGGSIKNNLKKKK